MWHWYVLFSLQEGAKFIDVTLGNLRTSTSAENAAKTSDLVIEAIVENLDIKKKLFSSLDAVAPQ